MAALPHVSIVCKHDSNCDEEDDVANEENLAGYRHTYNTAIADNVFIIAARLPGDKLFIMR